MPTIDERIQIRMQRMMKEYEKALDDMIDKKAQEKGYDNRITATMRAGVVGSPFQQECISFAKWMDSCYMKAYEILNAVQAGVRSIPSITEFLREMPEFKWEATV